MCRQVKHCSFHGGRINPSTWKLHPSRQEGFWKPECHLHGLTTVLWAEGYMPASQALLFPQGMDQSEYMIPSIAVFQHITPYCMEKTCRKCRFQKTDFGGVSLLCVNLQVSSLSTLDPFYRSPNLLVGLSHLFYSTMMNYHSQMTGGLIVRYRRSVICGPPPPTNYKSWWYDL